MSTGLRASASFMQIGARELRAVQRQRDVNAFVFGVGVLFFCRVVVF